MKKLSGITRRHEQFHLTYGVSDEADQSHENISLIMARGVDATKVLAGFGEGAGFHLEVRYLDPADPDTILRELTHRFTHESYQRLVDAVNDDAESFTVLCNQECLATDEVTKVELVLPLKDNRRLDIFVQRFMVLVRAMTNGVIDDEYPYDFNITQPAAEA